jgi:hypothetical protein
MEELSAERRKTIPQGAFLFPERRGWPIDTRKRALTAIQYIQRGFRVPSDPAELAELKRRARKEIQRLWGGDEEIMAALKGI